MAGASRAELRRFGLTVGGVFLLLALASWWRAHVLPPRVLAALGLLLVGPGLVAPAALGPVRRVWLRAATLLGEVNSRVLLTVLFYLVIAPVGFVLRHLVRDPLDRSLADGKASNWVKRELENYCGVAPRGLRSFLAAMPVWLKEKLFTRDRIRRALGGYAGPVLFAEHHESHAASAFYPSPFAEAAVLTMDGVGEWATSSYGVGRGKDLELFAELHYPHSLGMLYSAFTYYTGFKVNSGEYKVMGLAPYGTPRYVDLIFDKLVQLKDDGSFKLNLDYFNYVHGLTMTNGP